MEPASTLSFSAVIEKFDSNLWGYHLAVSEPVGRTFITDSNDRRVVCTLNGSVTFQCALMPRGDGSFFINVNKKIRDQLKLKAGSVVEVTLSKDESRYGLPMPEEMEELLGIDDEGNRLFHALTPGKQRTLLYIVGSASSSDKRIARAITVVDHLKANTGKINFRQLSEELKAR